MIVVVTATEEAETTEYGEDFAARVYWIEESWSGKCVFLADMDVKDDSGNLLGKKRVLVGFNIGFVLHCNTQSCRFWGK
ncbi:hypothetical protein ACSQ67_019758 [Phaseolus vulgaris]